MIDKKGDFVFTANQNTDNIVVFARDKETGKLTPNGENVIVPSVTCLVQL
jgi:6-phosphogluconolactonase